MSSTLAVEIDQILEREIIEGRLRPGQRLLADELAAQFGVSRIPIRESLRALDAAGWVEIRPRHGVHVRRWSRSELQQLFDVRRPLEIEASGLAAAARTGDELAQLELNVDAYERAIESDQDDVADLNREFHRLVAVATHNGVLAELLDKIGRRVQWYFAAVVVARSPSSAADHRELVAAIAARDVAMSRVVMERHVGSTREAVAAAMRQLDPTLVDP